MSIVRHWRLISNIMYALVAAAAAALSSPAAASWGGPGFYVVWSDGTPDGPFSTEASCQRAGAQNANPGERWECRYLAHNPKAQAPAEQGQDQDASTSYALPTGSPQNPGPNDNWRLLGKSHDGAEVYIDERATTPAEYGVGTTTAVVDFVYPTERHGRFADRDVIYQIEQARVELFCGEHRAYPITDRLAEDMNGTKIQREYTPHGDILPVEPDTIAEGIYEDVCRE